jgi:hypothetical protein
MPDTHHRHFPHAAMNEKRDTIAGLHRPHAGTNLRDHTRTFVTAEQREVVRARHPAAPMIASSSGVGTMSPVVKWLSEWQIPATAIFTSTSPSRGGSSVIYSISQSLPTPRGIAPRHFIGRLPAA